MYSGCIRKSISGTNYLQKLSTTNMPEIINTKIQNILYRHAKEIRDKSVSHVCILEESIKDEINSFFDDLIEMLNEPYERSPLWVNDYIRIRKFYL